MQPDAADTLGIGGSWFDPLWRVPVELSPLERALLDSWPVRRLGMVAHAGAAALTTTQTYSRLEHSLGVLALAPHSPPRAAPARPPGRLTAAGHRPSAPTREAS